MRNLKTTALVIATLWGSTASAQEFFDTSIPEEVFGFGARIGFNTSVSSVATQPYDLYSHDSWGTGFDLGIVANINVRDYLSIQSGLFFQSRSSDYTYINMKDINTIRVDVGHLRRYAFDIPVIASVHFNITDRLRWNVEFGPYMSFNLKTDMNYMYKAAENDLDLRHKSCDVGFKMGSGFTFDRRYVVAAHYMAGCNDAWKDPSRGGHNKGWTFTVGYDF